MTRIISIRIKAAGVGILAAALFFGAPNLWSQTLANPVGIENFARVTDALYRGAQPSMAGFSALQHMGVGIIVNFRNEPKETSIEKSEVESLGMKYVGIPWSGSNNPSNTQIVQFLDLLRANPQTKIFVHCHRGADRTGTMVAAYRIAVQRESAQEAVREMHSYHYDHFFLPQLERYVLSLPDLLRSDPIFRAYALPTPLLAQATTAPATSATSH